MFSIFLVTAFMLLAVPKFVLSSELPYENRVLAIAQEMESVFRDVEDYTADVEIIYYEDGVEDERWRLRISFKRERKIRMDFYHPWRSTVFYNGGDEEIILKPFRFLPLKFRLSLKNTMATTPTGQRVDQADMKYLLEFLLKNLKSIQQIEDEFQDDGEQIKFLLWALDHVEGKHLEKYRFFVSKRNWLPMRLERYNLEDEPIETAIFKNHAINVNLEDKLFRP